MTNIPLSEKLKGKKLPVTECRIFVGDRDKYKEEIEESFSNLLDFLKSIQDREDLEAPVMETGKKMLEKIAKLQEPYYQRFVFKALKPTKFEKLMDEYPPPKGKETDICDWEAFNARIFKECMVEPAYDSLTDDEWGEFFEACSHKEFELLMNTAMDANIRNADPQSPKDLMTQRSR